MYSCRVGACSAYVVNVVSGFVDKSDDTFIKGNPIREFYVLPYVAYPTSYYVIHTLKENEI